METWLMLIIATAILIFFNIADLAGLAGLLRKAKTKHFDYLQSPRMNPAYVITKQGAGYLDGATKYSQDMTEIAFKNSEKRIHVNQNKMKPLDPVKSMTHQSNDIWIEEGATADPIVAQYANNANSAKRMAEIQYLQNLKLLEQQKQMTGQTDALLRDDARRVKMVSKESNPITYPTGNYYSGYRRPYYNQSYSQAPSTEATTE